MGHTNSTTNYHLPQFVTTDKPAWLTDINGAFYDTDTAIKAVSDVASSAQSNATSALSTAGSASTAATTADAKGSGAIASLADAFDTTSTYIEGDLVMYNNLLYICSTAVTTPGAWTGSTNWTRTTAEAQIPGNAGQLPLGNSTPAGSTAKAIADINSALSVTNNTDTILNYGGTIGYRKYGNIVEVWLSGLGSSNIVTQNSEPTIYNLPSGYRPKYKKQIVGYWRNSFKSTDNLGYQIDTNGNITVYAYDAISNGNFTCTYIVD